MTFSIKGSRRFNLQFTSMNTLIFADVEDREVRLYLTGGDAEVLKGWLETRVELRADLVLEGLALFAGARAEAGR